MALTKVSGQIIDQPFELANINATGIGTFANLRVTGDLQVDGTTTTLDTVVTSVDRLEIGANNSTVGVAITQSGAGDILNLYDGSTEVFTVRDGGDVGINTTTFAANGTNFKVSDGTISRLALDKTGANARGFEIGNFGTGLNVYDVTADEERLRIDAAGNVGVNQSSVNSTRKVEITQPSSFASALRINTAGSAGNPGYVEWNTGSSNYKIGVDHSSDNIRIKRESATLLRIDSAGNFNLESDSAKFTAGASNDLQIYHNGTDSYISDTATGSLVLTGSRVIVKNAADNARMIDAIEGGAVKLLHNNSEKLETTATGITVTGNIVGVTSSYATKFYGDGSALTGIDATQIQTGNTSVQTIDTGSDGQVKVTTEGTERVIINGDGSNSVKVGTAATLTGAFTNLQLHNAGGSSRIVLTDQFTGTTDDDGFHIQCSGSSATLNMKENSHIYFRTQGLLRAAVRNDGAFKMSGSNPVTFGDNEYFKIYYDGSCNIENTHSSSNFFIASALGLQIRVNTSEPAFAATANGKVQLFYDGAEKFETSSSGVKALGTLDLGSYQNSGLTYSPIYDSAVDVFVYDTRKDSDGGAWRKRCQHTSWYNETLNTSTRGSRREFPAVAVIVTQATRVTIYDGDDPLMPMWMKFEPNGIIDWPTSNATRIYASAVNGIMATVTNDGGHLFKFIEDYVELIYLSTNYPLTSSRTIAGRNDTTSYTSDGGAGRVYVLGSYSYRDVAMTVLPNAPIDDATGLPTPSVVVAHDNGLSVINYDGTVSKLSDNLSANRKFEKATIIGTDVIGYNDPNGTIQRFFNALNVKNDSDNDMKYNYTYGGGGGSTENISAVLRDTIGVPIGLVKEKNRLTAFNSDGISKFIDGTDRTFTPNSFTIKDSAVAYITSDYNTGYMYGDIRGAYLSDTDTTNVTGSGELITNGTFTSDASGWTSTSGATITQTTPSAAGIDTPATDGAPSPSDTGIIKIVSNGSASGAYQTFTTVVGKRYVVSFVSYQVSYNSNYVKVGTSAFSHANFDFYGPDHDASCNNNWASGSFTFTATATTTYITLIPSQVSGRVLYMDQVSVKLAEEDRSVIDRGLPVTGTITKSAVATGAELVAYSGWSSSNYMEASGFIENYGSTPSICYMAWVKQSGHSNYSYIICNQNRNSNQTTGMALHTSNGTLYVYDGSNVQAGSKVVTDGQWHQCVGIIDGKNVRGYVDGEEVFNVQIATAPDLSTTAMYGVGHFVYSGLTRDYHCLGSLALVRVSKSLPSEERIKEMYEEEKELFKPNADATLYGSSDAVTAAAFDDTTNLLHAGTSAGRSDFNGLRRINNTTTAVTTAISASNELISEQ